MVTNKTSIEQLEPPVEGALQTKREIARFLKVTPRTVENFMRRGLPYYRFGARRSRFDLSAVRNWLDRECRITRVQ